MNRIPVICFISAFMVCSSTVFSQISEGGLPPSLNTPLTLRSAISATEVPIDFYIGDLRETDYWQARAGVPMPIAQLIPVDYTIDNAGQYTLLPGGESIWRLRLKARDAIAVMLYYSDFYIPEGGRLFIYNADYSQVLGAYTHRTHPSGGLFATEFVGGDDLFLEYVASATSDEKPRIAISEIGYGYHTAALREFCPVTTYAAAGSCEVNINCEEGAAWQNEKKGVCYTTQKIGSKTYMCTGSLLNNTAENFKPLLLTALHCASDGEVMSTAAEMQQWMFYFHRERELCNNTSIITSSKTMTGCTLLAATGMERGSDGLLVTLNDMIPDDYDVFYNGWDCTGEAAVSGVTIHHPNGDYKKISTYDETISSYTFNSSDFTGDAYGHWNAIFISTPNGHGVTEGGSSGSPLFNENKLVVGTLSGGLSSCTNLKGVNLFGKFSYHWDRYKKDSTTRMDVWLDPLNKGVKALAGRYRTALKPSPYNFKAVYLGNNVSLTWSAPQSSERPQYYNVYRNNMKIDETTSLSYTDNNPVFGSIVYSVSAVYGDGNESSFVSAVLSIVQYKAPTGLTAVQKVNNQIEISWKAPVYEQTIYWGTLDPVYRIGFSNKIPFYFGQKWTADEIQSLHLKTIRAIQFLPIQNNLYEIYITQGDHSYRQPIASALLITRNLNTINLTTPFVIDGTKPLTVSIFVSRHGAEYAAWCDYGPVENGKGNLCAVNFSGDTIEWELLNDDEEPGEYDINFVLAAIVSSDNGQLPDQTKKMDVSQHYTSILTKDNNIQLRKASMPLGESEVSIRNAMPSAFPEITRYRIYKSGSSFMNVYPPATSFFEKFSEGYSPNNIYYEVSAFYDQVESAKTDRAYINFVDNELTGHSISISPTIFTDYIMLKGNESVSRVEVLSVSGKRMLDVTQPDPLLNTSSLAPGFYFFRITDVHHNQTIVKGVKSE